MKIYAINVTRKFLKLLGLRITREGWNTIDVSRTPATIIDVGCGYGTKEFYKAFPSSYLFLIDPLKEYIPHINNILKIAVSYSLLAAF